MSDNLNLPPYEAWITAPEMNADKALAITAVALIGEMQGVSDEKAYDLLRAYVTATAKHFGYDVEINRA